MKDVLRDSPHTWLVNDALSMDSQFHSDWQQVMRRNTAKIWEEDGVMIFSGEGLVVDTPTEPDIPVNRQLENGLTLAGYSRAFAPDGIRLNLFCGGIGSAAG